MRCTARSTHGFAHTADVTSQTGAVDPRPPDPDRTSGDPHRPSPLGDPDRPSPLGRKALILGPILVAVGIVLWLLRFPPWVTVGALLLFLIWLLIDG